jgi:hypothetical protein
MHRWLIVGSIIEKIDTKKKWVHIRRYVAGKIINTLEEV